MHIESTGITNRLQSHQAESYEFENSRTSKKKGAEVRILEGKPSERVIKPRLFIRSGEIHFNRDLSPGGIRAVTPKCKKYIPDVEGKLYNEVSIALTKGIRFVTCLIDLNPHDSFTLMNALILIEFCNTHSIPIIKFSLESDVAGGYKFPKSVRMQLTPTTKNIIKPTYSIFSTPDTHEVLKDFIPDALIFSGAYGDVCIHASSQGYDETYSSALLYGAEFGATQYGFPVYIHPNLITGELVKAPDNDLLFCFSRLK